ncbi:MAG: hypothetical protein UV82_C0011G0059 [Candidatus Magasanikbacteria bacterium GW2011_GWD2_43_18]|uniref:Uncharacterized protein n=1 Tax=Candidatus Magasanikbacteria bacterium GW2011_GWE2_42_7 TaxID=1619052 RepID=A0A0G1E6K6_9BACT|nr:MAG: hypothetical protein UV18_C0007G0064 [Candidatus Magasanikbacteria bacterium GW2011_GWC2_42_27]KKS70183.1 MAG: hypothetical protein UV42_C0066G0003 [Candidatus Magasanikbacteria bacterium GW2011_GWE2_42_7]KKT04131.1 MAG: hypothetical protein UV82_C0011G0059 [Candidatus Magasanikbacteria bacterium GW2011_GWD2_43_18]
MYQGTLGLAAHAVRREGHEGRRTTYVGQIQKATNDCSWLFVLCYMICDT